MKNLIKSFAANESGAATVDYVILLAGVVALAIAAMTQVTSLSNGLIGGIQENINNYEVSANNVIANAGN